ncbi:group II intron reverse transcriptase/maturase [Myxococcota bacterium]|nr:group II intron reverse transcriptase/maturase [Myxococcota bacterium]
MEEAQDSIDISTRLRRIAEIARAHPNEPLRTLAHHVDEKMFEYAYWQLKPGASAGIDGETHASYAGKRKERYAVLRDQMHGGTYRAPPVRRVYIPKDNGQRRPLGIPTLEDKLLQRAITSVLEAVYEQSFFDCSYGYRAGRSAHQALEALWKALMSNTGGWVIEADIEQFFDTLEHGQLREMLARRIQDGVLLRMVGKWLNAGVMEEGRIEASNEGTPQGGVISPLLANVYLHEVLDSWFEREVKPRLRGSATLVRYADDFVIVFQFKEDAERVYEVLPKRFGRFGLRLHPDKTRLLHSRPRPPSSGTKAPSSAPFDFLGFSHYWDKTRRGRWVLVRKTMRKRITRTLKRIWEWCRRARHEDVEEQRAGLNYRLLGHYAYFGLSNNYDALARVHHEVKRIWRYWLCRRSNRGRLTWEEFHGLLKRHPLARPRITHPTVRQPS